ncbi:MAG: helix-turn-helix transcriptional regulator [Lachnospiraceae bacterium]|nr:helix-turn-helix transcriptional regulator [Lachnospiraceae bacterium]
MGRKSNKDDKSVYQKLREDLGLTREKASENIGFISAAKIEKIENGKVSVQPDDVIALAECYKAPELCNYYCSNECPIGRQYIPEVKIKDLAQIAIETLNSLNKMNKEKDRLLEIVEDGLVTPDEYNDFFEIKKTLEKISLSVDTLQLWVDKSIADGNMQSALPDNGLS